MNKESSDTVRFDLQGQTGVAKLKSAYNSIFIEKCCLSSNPC